MYIKNQWTRSDKLFLFIAMSCILFFLTISLTIYDIKWTHKQEIINIINKDKKQDIHLSSNSILVINLKTKIRILEGQIELLANATDADKFRWGKISKISLEIRNLFKGVYKLPGCTTRPSSKAILTTAGAMVDASIEYGVELPLILAVAHRESVFHNCAKSSAGAYGIMQLMPRTARYIAKEIGRNMKISKERDNVYMGVYYLSDLLIEFNGDIELAVKSYNAGPKHIKNVLSGKQNLYYQETIEYWEAVKKYKKEYEQKGL